MRKHNRSDDDDDPMAIARALQADHVRSGSHRGEGSPTGRSSRNAPRSRAGRAGGSSARGGRGTVPARPSPLSSMPPPGYSTPNPPRMAPRPIVSRAPAMLGSVSPTSKSAAARSGPTVPVLAIRSAAPVANTSQRLDPVRAPVPFANVNPTAEDYDDLPAHMMKPPAPRRAFPERVVPEATSQNGNGSTPSANGSVAVKAHSCTVMAQDGGDAPFVGYYQDDTPRAAPTSVQTGGDAPFQGYYQAKPSLDTVTPAQNDGDAPFVGYYQDDAPRAAPATAQNGADAPFVGYYQDEHPRITNKATVFANTNTSRASAPIAPFCQDEAVQHTANRLAVQNAASVPSLSHSRHGVPSRRTTPAEPHVFTHIEPDAPDLMDIDVEDPVPSIPVFGTIDLSNREQASATTSAFPGLSSARVGNREAHGAASNLLVGITNTRKQPEPKCTCVKQSRGLGSSRWADPAPEQSTFVHSRNGTPAECPVHNPRPAAALTPTAPVFVPRSGTPVPPVGATLTPEAPEASNGPALATQTLPTPTQPTATLPTPAFQVLSGDKSPWILL